MQSEKEKRTQINIVLPPEEAEKIEGLFLKTPREKCKSKNDFLRLIVSAGLEKIEREL